MDSIEINVSPARSTAATESPSQDVVIKVGRVVAVLRLLALSFF